MARLSSIAFLLLARSGACLTIAAAQSEADSKDGIDRFAQVQVSPKAAYVSSALIVSAATGLQVMTPGWVQRTFGDACKSGVGALALQCANFLDVQKRTNPLGLVLGHGVITKACADVLAQTIPQQDAPLCWIDPLRGFRSMLASVLSTSLPFYYWTRFMARSMPVAPGWITALLGNGLGTATFKTVVTQVLFRPLNVFLFLALQSVFRGDSARALVSIIDSKFKASIMYPHAGALEPSASGGATSLVAHTLTRPPFEPSA